MANDLVVAVVVDDAQALTAWSESLPKGVRTYQYAVEDMATKTSLAMDRVIQKQLALRDALLASPGVKSGQGLYATEAVGAQAALNKVEKQLKAVNAIPPTIGQNLDQLSQRSVAVGKTMSRALTLPIIVAFGVATKMFIDFQRQMEMIHTQAGAPQAEVSRQTKAILNYATSGQSPISPMDLSKALYYTESRGYRGKTATRIMEMVAQYAGLGNAPAVDVSQALGGALTTYFRGRPKTQQIQKIMATITSIVGQGAMTMADFAAALKTGVAASGVGPGGAGSRPIVDLKEIGAALDVLTDRGMPAQMAATRLRMTIAMMEKPTQAATKALGDLGIGQYQLVKTMESSPDGMVRAMMLIEAAYRRMNSQGQRNQAQGDILQIFGKGRSSAGILTVLNSLTSNVSSFQGKLRQITADEKNSTEKLTQYHQTAAYKIATAWNAIKSSFIQLGGAITPTVANIIKGIASMVTWFSHLPSVVKGNVLVFLALGAALGPVLYIGGNLIRVYQGFGKLFTGLASTFTRSGQSMKNSAEATNAAVGPEREAAAAQGATATAAADGEVKAAETSTLIVTEDTNATLGPERATAAATGATSVEAANAEIQASNAETATTSEALNTTMAAPLSRMSGLLGGLRTLAGIGAITVGINLMLHSHGLDKNSILGSILTGAGAGFLLSGGDPLGALIGAGLALTVDVFLHKGEDGGVHQVPTTPGANYPNNGGKVTTQNRPVYDFGQPRHTGYFGHGSKITDVTYDTRSKSFMAYLASGQSETISKKIAEKILGMTWAAIMGAIFGAQPRSRSGMGDFNRGQNNEFQASGKIGSATWRRQEGSYAQGRAKLLRFAREAIGKPYAWGGAGPNSFDCSGLVMWAFANGMNIQLPHLTDSQAVMGSKVRADRAHVGDVVFTNPGEIEGGRKMAWGHEGMIVGFTKSGQPIIEAAPHSGAKVQTYTGYGAFTGGNRYMVRDLTSGAGASSSPTVAGMSASLGPRHPDRTAAEKAGHAAADKIIKTITETLKPLATAVSAAFKRHADPSVIEGDIKNYLSSVSDDITTVRQKMKTKNPTERQYLKAELIRLEDARTSLQAELAAEVQKAQLILLTKTFKKDDTQYSRYSKNISGVMQLSQYSNVPGSSNYIPGIKTDFTKAANAMLSGELTTLQSEVKHLKTQLKSTKIAGVRAAITAEISKLQRNIQSVNSSFGQVLQNSVSEAQQAYQNAMSNVENSLSSLGNDILSQFQQQTQSGIEALQKQFYQSGNLTPEEQALKAFQDQMNAKQLQRALADAQQQYITDISSGADVQTLQSDAYAIQQAQDAIQLQALENAATASRTKADQDYADAEKAYQADRQIQEQHLQEALKELAKQVADGTVTFTDTNDVTNALNPILSQFGVSLSGVDLDQFKIDMVSMGKAITDPGTGLTAATNDLQSAFESLVAWINKTTGLDVGVKDKSGGDGGGDGGGGGGGGGGRGAVGNSRHVIGLASGGIVTRPMFAMLGEDGHEAVIPLSKFSARASENCGDVHIHLHGPVIGNDLDKAARQLAGPIRAELTKIHRRNATPIGI